MVFLEVEIDEDGEEVSEFESLVLVLDDSDDEDGKTDDHSAHGHKPTGRAGHLMNVVKR